MNQLGVVKFHFSEELRSIEDMHPLNLTFLSNDDIFEVEYHTLVEVEQD